MSAATDAAPAEEWRARLAEAVAMSGRTQHMIAVESGLNPAFLSQVLGKKGATPRVDNLQRIAAVLGTSVAWIVDGVGQAPQLRRDA